MSKQELIRLQFRLHQRKHPSRVSKIKLRDQTCRLEPPAAPGTVSAFAAVSLMLHSMWKTSRNRLSNLSAEVSKHI